MAPPRVILPSARRVTSCVPMTLISMMRRKIGLDLVAAFADRRQPLEAGIVDQHVDVAKPLRARHRRRPDR